MTEKAIQDKLWSRLQTKGASLVVPNYTPLGWFECDVFSVTKAGFMVEYEIKLSVADFRADTKKARSFYPNRDKEGATFADRWHSELRTKHELLGASIAHEKGPSRYFYVVPEGMLKAEDAPKWAGLMYYVDEKMRSHISVVKEAPKLHNTKCGEQILKHALGVMYWRYWHLRTRLKRDHSPAQSIGDDYSI